MSPPSNGFAIVSRPSGQSPVTEAAPPFMDPYLDEEVSPFDVPTVAANAVLVPDTLPTFRLTEDQDAARRQFVAFLLDPEDPILVIEGYAGCGKTTLVKTLLDGLPQVYQTVQLLNPQASPMPVELTATTNKAAEALAQATGKAVSTIHSYVGLRVRYSEKGEAELVATDTSAMTPALVFIDEASYIDSALLTFLCQRLKGSKVVFIGDPAQLTPVKTKGAPVFLAKFPTARLTSVVRQAEGNPIIDLATAFRETVETGKFFSFTPDGYHVQHVTHDQFDELLQAEFGRENWKYHDSKVLAWTNRRVIDYNHAIREYVAGDPSLQAGDYAVCNSYVQASGGAAIKTDQMVQIQAITPAIQLHDVPGQYVVVEGKRFFFPTDRIAQARRLKQAQAEEDDRIIRAITQNWIDLRAAYACTINKAQGSTFDKVFIDLSDIRRCRQPDVLARMLYVAVSRARHHVYFVGDLV